MNKDNKSFVFIRAFSVGLLTFWSPILMARIILGEAWRLALIPLTFALPVLVCFALQPFCDRFKRARPLMGIAFVFGIWASGPFWISLVSTFDQDAGFHVSGTLAFLAWGTLIFPLSTFSMATYQGSLFALLLSTLAIGIFSATSIRIFAKYRERGIATPPSG